MVKLLLENVMGSFNATCGISGMPIWAGVEVIGTVIKQTKGRDIAVYATDYYQFAGDFTEGVYNDYGGIDNDKSETLLSDRIERGNHKDGSWEREWVNIWMCRRDIYEEMLEDTITSWEKQDKKYKRKKYTIRNYVEKKITEIKKVGMLTDEELKDPMKRFSAMRRAEEAMRFSEGGTGKALSDLSSKVRGLTEVPTDEEIDAYRKAYSIFLILGSICKPLTLHGNIGSQNELDHMKAFTRMNKKVSAVFRDRKKECSY